LLNILEIPLACTCFPFLSPMICRFGLLMKLQSSWVFLLQLLSLCLRFFRFILKYLVCLQALKLCLPLVADCWSSFQLYFLFDLRDFLLPGFLFNSFFWDFPYLCYTLLSYLVLLSLFHIFLYFSFYLLPA
jgi:hypothetical protein